MDERLTLHSALQAALPGLSLFFGSTAKDILTYPCIVYDLADLPATYANNEAYTIAEVYKVTVMSRKGSTRVNSKPILTIPGSSLSTTFTNDDIVHDIFNIVIGVR